MEQTGVVLKTDKKHALVRILRSTACGGNCADCNLCEKKEIERWVLNSAGAKNGDTVLLFTKSSSVILMAFVAYIVPIIAALTACLVMTALSLDKAVIDWTSVGIFIAAIFFVARAGFFRGEKYTSRITEIIGNEQN